MLTASLDLVEADADPTPKIPRTPSTSTRLVPNAMSILRRRRGTNRGSPIPFPVLNLPPPRRNRRVHGPSWARLSQVFLGRVTKALSHGGVCDIPARLAKFGARIF